MGGPYPTSRALEARSRGTIAPMEGESQPLSTADAARYIDAETTLGASILEWTGRAAGIGGLTSLLVVGSDNSATNNPVAAEAYRETSEVVEKP